MSEYTPELLGTPLNGITFSGVNAQSRRGYAVPLITNPNQVRNRVLKYADFYEYLQFLERKVEDSTSEPIGEYTNTSVLIDNITLSGTSSTWYCKGTITGSQYIDFFIVIERDLSNIDSIDADHSYCDIIYRGSNAPSVHAAIANGTVKILFNRASSSHYVLKRLEVGTLIGSGTIDTSNVSFGSGSLTMPTTIPVRISNGVIQVGRLADGIVGKSNLNYVQTQHGTQWYIIKNNGTGDEIKYVDWNTVVGIMNRTQHVTRDMTGGDTISTRTMNLDNDTLSVADWNGDITFDFIGADRDFEFYIDGYSVGHVGSKITVINNTNYRCTVLFDSVNVTILNAKNTGEFRLKESSGDATVDTRTLIRYSFH